MTYSAEFIVNVGQYEHVKLTVSADSGPDLLAKLEGQSGPLGEWVGDYHASLKAAVLHGRDEAYKAAEQAAADMVKSGLGATVIEDVPAALAEVFKDTPEKPWKRPVTAAQAKPWESSQPITGTLVKAPSTASLLDDF